MTQHVRHGVQCIFFLNRCYVVRKKTVSRKGVLCSVLSFACQFLYKSGMQCPGKQCCGEIIKYFIAAPCVHAQEPQWQRTEMWHVKFMGKHAPGPGKAYRETRGGDLGQRTVSGGGRQEKKKSFGYLQSSDFVTLSALTQILWDTVPTDWILKRRSHVVRNTAQDTTSRDFLASLPGSVWLLGGGGKGDSWWGLDPPLSLRK